jgi:hypothetical protein
MSQTEDRLRRFGTLVHSPKVTGPVSKLGKIAPQCEIELETRAGLVFRQPVVEDARAKRLTIGGTQFAASCDGFANGAKPPGS